VNTLLYTMARLLCCCFIALAVTATIHGRAHVEPHAVEELEERVVEPDDDDQLEERVVEPDDDDQLKERVVQPYVDDQLEEMVVQPKDDDQLDERVVEVGGGYQLDRAIVRDCACSRDYTPVCANKDGMWITYDNRCQAKCGGATDIVEGVCPKNTTEVENPPQVTGMESPEHVTGVESPEHVTGVESPEHVTGVMEKTRRKRAAGCVCNAVYSPHCGKVNRRWITFGNRCYADCEGATNISRGSCERDTMIVRRSVGDMEKQILEKCE